jgi:PPP family 3-phenylpropionic acid transporter
MWLSGRLIARWGLRLVLLVSLAAISLRLSLFVLAPALGLIALAQLLHAFTFGTFHPAAVAYVNTKIPAEHRGLGMAIYTAVGIGLASFSASVAGGYVVEAFGYRTLFISYALIPLAAIAILFTKPGRIGILDPWKPPPS